MERFAIQDLLRWKNSPRRKPLILCGARQTGKTWLMKEFGSQYFAETLYISFENEPRFRDLFKLDFDVWRIIEALELYQGKSIDPANTLIIFDEIQSVERGITSLKYFYENAPEYAIVAADSLLGVNMHKGESFPVGKVNFINLYPMTFGEFMYANGRGVLYQTMLSGQWDNIELFHSELNNLLRVYFITGGMPEVVDVWLQTRDFRQVRELQHEILRSYQADFSKHAPVDQLPRLNMVWQSLPTQLSKENKKFVYGVIREGARAKDYEVAITWLHDCGLIHKCTRINSPKLPLMAYEDIKVFKIFMADIGLLSALSGVDYRSLLEGDKVFTEYKGAMTEQFAMQELMAVGTEYVGYWTNERSTAEIDFMIQKGSMVVPIEVKAGENLHARSLTAFVKNNDIQMAIKASTLPMRAGSPIVNIPLYALSPYVKRIE